MKKFDYPAIQVSTASELPKDVDSVLEWRETSQHALINQQLKGERSLSTLLVDGTWWSFRRAPGLHSPFEYLTLARAHSAGILRSEDRHLAIVADREELMDAALSAVLARQYQLPRFGRKDQPNRPLIISLVGPYSEELLQQRQAEAEGNALVRFLTALPASELIPESYRKWAKKLAANEGWEYRCFSFSELEKMGAGAFTAVAQGSEDQSSSIVRLSYCGDPDSDGSIALVGKGVTMDTGGYNLKTSGSMFGMHGDMSGSAVAVSNLLTASRLKQKVNLTCWLAITENHLGPKAYHANEVVQALNGTMIEVVDTDAEGRMILADTLTLASREKPEYVIDYATLTGACVSALSTRYSGAFTNHMAWLTDIIEAGKASGERVWPFPMDFDYDENIKSSVADVQQCNPGKSSDHIDAARFLSRFVETGVRWLHIDLASAHHKGGLAHVPTEVTGFGVRLTQELIRKLS